MRFAFVAAVCAGLAACTGSEPASQQRPAASTAADPATAATLIGQVAIDGSIPPADVIRMDGDPQCAALTEGGERRTELIVSNDGKTLANVFVYVKDGLAPRMYPVPSEPVVFDQQQCRYVPRVVGLQVGQQLEIRNSDPLLHNIRGEGAINQPFDLGQPVQGMKTMKTFTTREVMIPIKCQVHAWMRAYIGVLEHPYFAVSDANGRFTIPQLPPGTYTIEAWHERLGTQTQQVTVAAKDEKTVDFSFKVT
jgi:Carboxypeptidase regulatory-like domain